MSQSTPDRLIPLLSLRLLLVVLPVAVFQFPSMAGDPERETLSLETFSRVSRFIEHFIDADKTASAQAALFSEDVEYYGHGAVSKSEIARDIARYSRRWPHRKYTLSEIHYIRPDPESDRVFVSYEIEYTVSNSFTTASGTAIYGAVITDLNGRPKIEWIKEKSVGSVPICLRDNELFALRISNLLPDSEQLPFLEYLKKRARKIRINETSKPAACSFPILYASLRPAEFHENVCGHNNP